MLDYGLKFPILEDLIDALTCGPDELGQRFLRKMKLDLEPFSAAHAVGAGQRLAN